MASNTQLNVGAAGDVIATKERTHDGDATKQQIVSLAGVSGTEGAYTYGDINGDATNGLDVDVTRLPALAAGTNNIGDVDVLTLPALVAGTANIGDVDVLTLPALPAGTNNIGDVDVLSVIPGTAATNQGKAVDAVAGATDTGIAALAVRDDALATLTPIDGDYTNFRVTSTGRLYTSATVDAALPAGTNNIGDVDVITLPALVAGTANIGDVDIASIAAGDNNIGNVDVLTLPALVAGTANIGDVDVLTLPALPAGTNNIGDVDILSVIPGTAATNLGKAEDAAHTSGDVGVMALSVRQDAAAALGTTDADYQPLITDASGRLHVNVGNTVTVGSHAVTNAGTFATQAAQSGTWNVTVNAAIAAGNNNIGDVDVASLPALVAGTANIGDVDVLTLPALPAGTNNIGDIDVLSVITGTGATNLGKAEDAAHTTADVGVMALAVRRDADTTLVDTTGDYAPLQVNAAGSLKVAIISGAGSGGTAIADGATFTRDTTSINPIGAVVETSAPTLTNGDASGLSMTTGGALRVAIASGGIPGVLEDAASAGGEEGVMMVAVRRDTAAVGSGTDGDFSTINVNSVGRLYATATIDAALPAGTNNIGDVDVITLPALAAGTNNIGDVDVLTLPALPAGTNNIGDVDVLSIVPGTAATNQGKAVDAVAGATDTGVAILAIRDDALTTLTPIDGDYVNLRVNSTGALHTSTTVAAALPAGTNNIGDVDIITLPALVAGTANIGDVDVLTLPALVAGSANIGDVDVLTVPADPFGVNADAGSATGSISAKLRFIAATGIPVTGTVTVASHAVTNAGTFATQAALTAGTNTNEMVGDVAQDAAVAGNPVLVGARASTATPTAMSADGDSVYPWATREGALVTAGAIVDDAAFTPGTSRVHAVGYTADEASIDSVDEGDIGAARMTLDRKQIVTNYAHAAAGGSTGYSAISAAAVLTAAVKASPGRVYGITAFNLNAAARFVRLYNMTTAPGTGDTANILWRGIIPGNTAGAGFVVTFTLGMQFSTGIGIRASAAIADNDATALAANELLFNVDYS